MFGPRCRQWVYGKSWARILKLFWNAGNGGTTQESRYRNQVSERCFSKFYKEDVEQTLIALHIYDAFMMEECGQHVMTVRDATRKPALLSLNLGRHEDSCSLNHHDSLAYLSSNDCIFVPHVVELRITRLDFHH